MPEKWSDFLLLLLILMLIVTLNLHGLCSTTKPGEVIRLGRAINCDVMLLQETNFFNWWDMNDFKMEFNVDCSFSNAPSFSNGVGFLIFTNSY